MWYYLFGLFWIMAFILSMQKFIVAAAAAIWYFDPVDDGTKDVSILEAIQWCDYHCGTIALGSFLIALVQLIRVIFEYIAKEADKMGDSQIKRCLECCIRCAVWCLEQCVQFITENAYIQCAVSNRWFC